jgi:hypothetical protein
MSESIIAPLVAGFASSPDTTGDRRFHRRGGNEREHAFLHVTARLRPLMEWWFMWLHRPAKNLAALHVTDTLYSFIQRRALASN